MEKKWIERVPSRFQRSVYEWLLLFIIAAILYLFIHKFIFFNANITGNSMEPTFSHGDKVVITSFSYWLGEPAYYDVIAFPYKGNPSEYYVKRIIGMPGDEIDLVDRQFAVNGKLLLDDFSDELIYALGDVRFPITVPKDSYFVLGDNRNESKDSRYTSVGCVPKSDILGKASFRIWPLAGKK